MAGEDGFFRGEVLDLLFEEENDEVLIKNDKIFDPLFMEATVEVSRSLFCIKFMKRDICKCNQIRHLRWLPDPYKTFGFPILTDVYVLFLDEKSWKIHV